MNRHIIVLTGPTGTGKSQLALALTDHFPLEIVNADSLQLFRDMDIGTAKPLKSDRRRSRHHLYDVLNPDQTCSSAWYAKTALVALEKIWADNKTPLVVGGSGFYLKALEFPPPELTPIEPAQGPLHDLWTYIQAKDPTLGRQLKAQDGYRIRRAAALIQAGYLPSQLWAHASEQTPLFSTTWIGLATSRAQLYHQLNQRAEAMFKEGLIDETQQLLDKYPDCGFRISKTIGYKEAQQYLQKDLTYEQAVEQTQQRTRHYAKRQITWFKQESRIKWLDQVDRWPRCRAIIENLVMSYEILS